VLISTHSTIFIDRSKLDNVYQLSLQDGYTNINKVDCVDEVYQSLGLRNSDYLFFDIFLAVEGPTEFELIPSLYKLKYNRTLAEDGIQLINLKGKDQYLNNKRILESVLSGFNDPKKLVFYILDADTNQDGENITLMGAYDIEDAILDDVWIEYVKNYCSIEITKSDLAIIRSKINGSNKFYEVLKDHLKDKIIEGKYLPKKGYNSGMKLSECFVDQSQIPNKINQLFDQINAKL
jgi:putative ATP-dependent endonuclease of OLD family